jgi:tRNA threonylcarbamoyladenosine biosynthesis protein TsaB
VTFFDRLEQNLLEARRPLLAVDTSSSQAAVALYDGHSLSTRSWAAERSHTTTLLAEIHHLLEAASLDASDLGAIAIATGPGAFTGLRVGFGVAKGLHLATGAPLIGISTLEATALPFAWASLPIVAVVGAGRSRLVWALFTSDDDSMVEARAPRNGTIDEMIAELVDSSLVIVAGELDDAQESTLSAADRVLLPPRVIRMRQPAALAELAWRRWQREDVDDATVLEPMYLSR